MKLLKKFIKTAKLISKVLCMSLLCQPSVQAWDIPAKLAKVESPAAQNKPLNILLIQEVHVQYEAQKAIAEILRHAIQKDHARLVFVEGGWGDVSLSYLRKSNTAKKRLEVAEQFLRQGNISGEEYLDITSALDFNIWGVEEEKLYRRNLEAFMKIEAQQEELLKQAAFLQKYLTEISGRALNPELFQFLQKTAAYRRGEMALDAYAILLKDKAGEALSPGAFPEVTGLLNLVQSADQPDPADVQLERNELIRALTRGMNRLEFDMLDLNSRPAQTEQEIESLEALLAAAHKHLGPEARTQKLEKQLAALRNTLRFNTAQLFAELDRLESQIAAKLAQSKAEKQLVEITAGLRDLENLFELEIGPDEFARLETGRIAPASWQAILEALGAKHGITHQVDFALLEKALPLCLTFYQAARERENAMVEKAIEKMKADGETTAVIIAGGFHAAPLKKLLEERGAGVTLVTPRFEASGGLDNQHRQYFQVLKEKWQGTTESVRTPAVNVQGGI